MAFEFKFPDVGEGISEGLLVKWRVKEGDTIKEDQVLAEVETDKAIVEVPSPKAGKVTTLHVQENQTIEVGKVMVTIEEAGTASTGASSAGSAPQPAKAPTVVGAISEELSFGPTPSAGATTIMPRVRQLAKELGVNVDQVKGTGPGGRITEDDVQKAAKSGGASSSTSSTAGATKMDAEKYGPVERKPFVGTRKSIAERLLKTTATTPLVTHFDIANVTPVDQLRKKLESSGKKATYMPFFIKAVVQALQAYPIINTSLDEATQEIIYKKHYHIGIAVDTEQGLMVPVIRDADKKSIDEIGKELSGIAERARSRTISLEEMRGGTFTISNVGAVGGVFATPIMNYPQAAILAIGRIREAAVVHQGKIEVGKEAPLSMTFDHRLIDGADAGRFVNKVMEGLLNPEKL